MMASYVSHVTGFYIYVVGYINQLFKQWRKPAIIWSPIGLLLTEISCIGILTLNLPFLRKKVASVSHPRATRHPAALFSSSSSSSEEEGASVAFEAPEQSALWGREGSFSSLRILCS